MEVDFYRSLPADTTVHTARVAAPDVSARDDVGFAAHTICAVIPHIVVLDSAVDSQGGKADEGLSDRVRSIVEAAVIDVAASTIAALREARASRITMVTPYRDDVNRRIAARLEAEHIHVLTTHGMGRVESEASWITAEEIHSFVQTSVGARVAGDALLLASSNFHAMSALSLLKMTYELPIITSNLAALRAVRRELHTLREGQLPPRSRAAAPEP